MKIRIPVLAVAALVALLGGCDMQDQQDDFAREASKPPSGFTQTDAGGTVIKEDPDDWRTSPVYGGIVRLQPAYPNPASAEDYIRIEVSIMQTAMVRGGLVLRVFQPGGSPVTLGTIPKADEMGLYDFYFSAGRLPRTGLHRVVVLDMASEVVAYGDLMIE